MSLSHTALITERVSLGFFLCVPTLGKAEKPRETLSVKQLVSSQHCWASYMIRFLLIALKWFFFPDNCIVCGSAPQSRGSGLVAVRLLRESPCSALPEICSVIEKDNYSLHVLLFISAWFTCPRFKTLTTSQVAAEKQVPYVLFFICIRHRIKKKRFHLKLCRLN